MTAASLTPHVLAQFAEAAIRLGRIDLGELLIRAAYARADDGVLLEYVEDVLIALRDKALDGGHSPTLAQQITEVLA